MKISIVTVCLNSAATLERTIESVARQGLADLEYIIIDGGSSYATLEIVRRYHAAGIVTRYLSEPDDGISDAFNKGIALCTGEVVGLLNADDQYLPGALEQVSRAFEATGGTGIVHANLLVEEPGGVRRRIRPRPFPSWWIYVDCPFNHPAFFVPRQVYAQVGSYDTSCRLAMDYDFYLRVMRHRIPLHYLDQDVTLFSLAGRSSSSPADCHREVLRIQLDQGLSPLLCYLTFSAKMLVNRCKRIL